MAAGTARAARIWQLIQFRIPEAASVEAQGRSGKLACGRIAGIREARLCFVVPLQRTPRGKQLKLKTLKIHWLDSKCRAEGSSSSPSTNSTLFNSV